MPKCYQCHDVQSCACILVCGPHQQRDPANITTKTILQNRIPPPLIKIVVLIICAGEGGGRAIH